LSEKSAAIEKGLLRWHAFARPLTISVTETAVAPEGIIVYYSGYVKVEGELYIDGELKLI